MNDIMNNATQTPIEIALGIDESGMTTAKKLYTFLELNLSNYAKWCRSNITENEFAEENVDYFYSSLSTSEQGRGNFAQDFKLTAHFAKKLSCKGNGERAEQAREYFATVEERAKEYAINRSQLSPQMQMFYRIADEQAKVELEQKRQAELLHRIEQKQDTITETFSAAAGREDFKKWVNRCIGKIAESPRYTNGDSRSARYQNVRAESYERLNQKRACRLTQRVAYAKETALQNGATKTVINSINRLTVISEDRDLKPIYETVIKEMMIAYCVEVA